jgi:hypothetical protein
MLTIERLKEVLDYNETTGVFTWRIKPNKRIIVGSTAGTTNSDGYIYISIDKRVYKGHQLAWFYINGNWPLGLLDHINVVKSNNWIKNLRCATRSQNSFNTDRKKSNTSGQRGVSYIKRDKVWRVVLTLDKIHHFLGNFLDKEEAIEVSKSFIISNHREFSYVKI